MKAAAGEMEEGQLEAVSFESLGLSPEGRSAMKRLRFRKPTAFQEKALPPILAGKDFCGKYGREWLSSGKTATYLVGMLEKLMRNRAGGGIKALILRPNFDTAFATYVDAHEMALAAKTDIEIGMVAGGVDMERLVEEMAKNDLDVMIATPDHLLSVLDTNPNSLSTVEYVVIDVAQEMMRMGFEEQLHQILGKVSENRQALIFTSKNTTAVGRFVHHVLREPEFVSPMEDVVVGLDSLNLSFLALRMDKPSPPCSVLTTNKRAADNEESSQEEAPGPKRRATNPMAAADL